MQITDSLTNHLLIAMPGLEDPNFSKTVTYICEHNQEGAMGIIINRPMDLQLGDILEQLGIDITAAPEQQQPIYLGGPVQNDRGFVLHTGDRQWASSLHITDQISITTSRDILEAIARHEGPDSSLIALGYAGWGKGQLEREISDNSWLSTPGTPAILFDIAPEKRWHAAAAQLGVDLNLLSGVAGHA